MPSVSFIQGSATKCEQQMTFDLALYMLLCFALARKMSNRAPAGRCEGRTDVERSENKCCNNAGAASLQDS